MNEYRKILVKYWGFSSFRPLQEDIIFSVAEGNDTLGLMPTGGGKSITFQVYSLSKEGICLVITPLIALMKDQVYNLKRRGIKATAVYSGMRRDEIEMALNNAVNGNFKFLYLSPERLQTDAFRERLKQMNVNLIAVDESHCISQWGYDFRPSYLEIANVREFAPDVPILALTATATPEVVKDIQEKLHFEKENVLQKSFERKNLAYVVRYAENKAYELLKIVKRIPGTAVIYVRNRNKTKKTAEFLHKYGISADYYHAGLSKEIREQKQEAWQNDKLRIMVSTNAFGMGIDKSDVRLVVHIDLPDSLEAYFQEAGRAGRDEKKAWAVLLYNDADVSNLQKRLKTNFPPEDKIRRVYESLGNYYELPVGAGKDMAYDFDIYDFSKKFKIDPITIHYSLKILAEEGYMELTDEVNNPSRVMFVLQRDKLYEFQVANKNHDVFIKLLLRSYTGLFTNFTPINEEVLAKRSGTTPKVIYEYLKTLQKLNILKYIPRKNKPQVVYTEERLPVKSLLFDVKSYNFRKKRFESRIEAVTHYAQTTAKCRSQTLLEYFGQKNPKRCGQCDVCLRRNELGLSKYEFDMILDSIKNRIQEQPVLLNKLVEESKYKNDKLIKVIEWLFDNNKIHRDDENKIVWGEKQG
ncbi:MAG: ATP-dependent DNA helicase RecQ [Bacteroidota bacterium]|nr:ATP-dependent DNA helicase RecQ [Bacteroidota bacterium]